MLSKLVPERAILMHGCALELRRSSLSERFERPVSVPTRVFAHVAELAFQEPNADSTASAAAFMALSARKRGWSASGR